MPEALIYDGLRTPRGKGKASGTLHEVRPIELIATVMRQMAQRHSLDTGLVEDVVLGCVTPLGEQGGNIARIAVLHADWDERVPGQQLNRFCASGLEAINLAAMKVMSGQESLVAAGGVESMSRVQMSSDGSAWFLDPQVNFTTGFIPQGVSADLIASLEGFDREMLDAFAVRSHQRAATAWQEKAFAQSVVPVLDCNGSVILDYDETVRPETSVEGLAALKPSFQKPGEMGFDVTALAKYPQLEQMQHLHHAGNSSGIVDGAALLLIGDASMEAKLKLKPRARIVATACVGSEPTIMLTGPIPATEAVLKKAGLKVDDIDLFEINEAFAAVVLKAVKDLEIDMDKVNVNGGSIAMGHPLGATGAMLLMTALDELERRQGRYGLITLCVGAGMGIATIIERLA
jgi:acetyl-CoA C-acetyltransferase